MGIIKVRQLRWRLSLDFRRGPFRSFIATAANGEVPLISAVSRIAMELRGVDP